jgi:hypothetical protein
MKQTPIFEQFVIENDFSRLTTISHFPLLFLRKMSHGSAIFQVKDKCTSLVGSRNKLDHSEKKYELPYDYVLLKIFCY